jgi:RNA polymerase sigma-70 factor (ECF subfamily)
VPDAFDRPDSGHPADALFAEYRQGVFRYLSRFVGHAETARDLTQDVFLRVTRSQVPETSVAGRKAWVFTIARNVALNHVRDRGRRPAVVALADSVRPPTQELTAALQQALGHLAEVDREVFLLREAAGLSYDEIAETCGLSIDAVRSRLHRAREQLRGALDATMARQRPQGIRMGGERTWPKSTT